MKIDVNNLEFGIETFGDVAYNNETRKRFTDAQSLRGVIKEGKLADELRIDHIAFGEHHRSEFSISSPEIVLSNLAAVTKQIKLGTAVTVLSTDDPVRVFERFSTLQALSNGRAEVMLGRGSFTESFPLYGYKLEDYDDLFDEKLMLFSELLKGKQVTWKGKLTQSLNNVTVYPELDEPLPVKIGVGGTPASIVRAANFGFPVVLAIIGGEPTRFAPYVELYERTAKKLNKPIYPVTMHSHGIITENDDDARQLAWDYLKPFMDELGVERGWPEMSEEHFNAEIESGAFYVGTPEIVAQKIAKMMPAVGTQRFDLVYGVGGQLQADRIRTINLYAEEVIPRVKELLGASS